MEPGMLVVLCTIAGVLASTATQNNVYMIAATTLVLEQLMTADTALALALLAVMQQPSMMRLFAVPRRPRRLWSDRLQPDTNKEESKGAWENIIMDKSARLRREGLPDRADNYYRYLVAHRVDLRLASLAGDMGQLWYELLNICHCLLQISNVLLIRVLLSLCCCQRLQQYIPVYWYL
ncbi:hypothetical protein COO60DRAFT_1066980 [Scenedesmus sp. NREL 46B-D3]|nr:hypothetical protein COO60DRAFT_1066980 [Scenedesmus sp. NREL 46B-D3]